MPQGAIWFPLAALLVTVALILVKRKKPANGDNENDVKKNNEDKK
ncbi:MAG: hypothetical protein Q8J78_05380 [Moraxellaceae bacterium]|nr:hypothetical protein [Moraxellaceae bacterium]